MKKKTKIITSVVSILIIALILLGLTYAYYLTRINGNTNDKSITVTTDNLELTYGDGNGTINVVDKIAPVTPTNSNYFATKTFSVQNNGSDTEYVVFIEDVVIKDIETDGTTTFKSNDFRYTLTCTNCTIKVTEREVFPVNGGILISNNISKNQTQNYELKIWYIDTGIDQSDDMNKTFSAKVNIDIMERVNPYSNNKNSLAYNIVNNSAKKQNNIRLSVNPYSKVAEEPSLANAPAGIIGETINIPLSSELDGILYYGDTSIQTDFESCAYGGECTNVNVYGDGTTTCNDIKGKYIFIDGPDYTSTDVTYVDDCNSNTLIINPVYESELSTTSDDYGVSYYYRGQVDNNYVTFADMCWRIVRIAGDGSTKLILEDRDNTCETMNALPVGDVSKGNWDVPTQTGGSSYTGNYGYNYENSKHKMSYLNPVTNANKSMARAFYDFQETFTEAQKAKLKSGDWCLADKAYTQSGSGPNYTYTPLTEYNYSGEMYYDSYVRLYGDSEDGYNPTLKCTGTKLNNFESVTYNGTEIIKNSPMYVGTITADEMVYAGGKVYTSNHNFYLLNDYQKSKNKHFWSLSPLSFDGHRDYAFVLYSDGLVDGFHVNIVYGFRPAVSLASNVAITGGNGTLSNPYVIG